MKNNRLLRKLSAGLVSLLLAVGLTGGVSACSLFYFGGDYTDDGANLFLRIEDQDGAEENKLYLVTPAGTNRAGEFYRGCYGFTWTFTHDNYRYISRRDDNLVRPCPGYEGTHDHRPYEEAGTNEYGLTVSVPRLSIPSRRLKGKTPLRKPALRKPSLRRSSFPKRLPPGKAWSC